MSTKVNIQEIEEGDIFSETNHLVALGKTAQGAIQFRHLATGEIVELSQAYVSNLLDPCDQYDDELIVGKEDKFWTKKQIEDGIKKGTFTAETAPAEDDLKLPGIRTIFEGIYTNQVFTVEFMKADKKVGPKKLKELRDAQIADAIAEIEETKKQKKGVAKTAADIIRKIQENPISEIIPGDARLLRGYKVQFKSRDGHYDCVDMDLAAGDSGKDNIRPVNISTITSIIYNRVKYVLEK